MIFPIKILIGKMDLENAARYFNFYEKNGRIPEILKDGEEFMLYNWCNKIKNLYDREPNKIDFEVKKFLLSKFPNFFKHNFEINQMEKAKEYVEYYEKNNKFQTDLGLGNNALKLYFWSNIIKDLYVCSSNKLDPKVKEFLITKIPNFFKDPIQIEQTKKVKEYIEFYNKYNRAPRCFEIEDEKEKSLSIWAYNIKNLYNTAAYKVDTEVKEVILSKFPLFFKNENTY